MNKQIEVQKVLNVLCKYSRVKTGIEIANYWIKVAVSIAQGIAMACVYAQPPQLKDYAVGGIVNGNGLGPELVIMPEGSVIIPPNVGHKMTQENKDINIKSINIDNIDNFIKDIKCTD